MYFLLQESSMRRALLASSLFVSHCSASTSAQFFPFATLSNSCLPLAFIPAPLLNQRVPLQTALASLLSKSTSSSISAIRLAADGRDPMKGRGHDQNEKCGMGRIRFWEGETRGRANAMVEAEETSWAERVRVVLGRGEGEVRRARWS